MGKPAESDSLKLMHQLVQMAGLGGLPDAPLFKRMVLVLDVDDVPRLYTEGFLEKSEGFTEDVRVYAEEKPVIVDTTTMQNQVFRTAVPLPRHSKEGEK